MLRAAILTALSMALVLVGCGNNDKPGSSINAQTDESGQPIPRSTTGDKGRYYLLEKSREGDIVKTLHKRVGADTVGFTRMEINCGNMKLKEIGYGEGSVSNIRINETDWFDSVPGSSKAVEKSP